VPEPAPKPDGEGPESEDARSAPTCPFCGARRAELISLFGTQAMTMQYRCLGCGSIFEAIKYD
jgi:DNA-directed RNA polymerase subunit RPC12/RpoP